MPLPTFPQPMSGDLYVFPWTGSAYETAYNLNCSKFDINTSDVEVVSRLSRRKASYKIPIQTIVNPNSPEITIDLDDNSSYVAALMFRGAEIVENLTGGSIVDEVITAKHDRYIQLMKFPIVASSVVLTNSSGATTYTENTDYVVDYDAGAVCVLSSGTIADAASLKIDYQHAAVTGTRIIRGGTVSQIKAKLMLAGQQLGENAKKGRFESLLVTLAPAGSYDLMAENPQVATLKGSFETVGTNAPFTLRTWIAS